jgi:hypothetical protein
MARSAGILVLLLVIALCAIARIRADSSASGAPSSVQMSTISTATAATSRIPMDNRTRTFATQELSIEEPLGEVGGDSGINEESHPSAYAVHRELLVSAQSEVHDTRFKSRMEQQLADAVRSASQRVGAKLSSFECRTRSCFGSLAWDDYESAVEGYANVAFQDYGHCEVSIAAEPPSGSKTDVYENSVVLNCERGQ